MAPATTAPATAPAPMPGPHLQPPPLHPHPPRHQADASVVVALNVAAIVMAASKAASVFFIDVSSVRRVCSSALEKRRSEFELRSGRDNAWDRKSLRALQHGCLELQIKRTFLAN